MCLSQASRMVPCPSVFILLGFRRFYLLSSYPLWFSKFDDIPAQLLAFQTEWSRGTAGRSWLGVRRPWFKPQFCHKSALGKSPQLSEPLILLEENGENGLNTKASCSVVTGWITVVESHPCHFLVGCPWASYLTSPSPCFFICKMGIVVWPRFIGCLRTSQEIVQITTP